MNAFAIKRIPNPEHTQRVLSTRRAIGFIPPSEGVRLALPLAATVDVVSGRRG